MELAFPWILASVVGCAALALMAIWNLFLRWDLRAARLERDRYRDLWDHAAAASYETGLDDLPHRVLGGTPASYQWSEDDG